MEAFLNEVLDWEKFELLIDTKIFNKEIILKSSHTFLDKWYFFFKLDDNKNIIVQFTIKDWVRDTAKKIISDYSDELLNNSLREIIFEENKEIRTEIITSALENSLREAELPNNWTWYDSIEDNYFDNWSSCDGGWKDNQIDFDKDIDDILKEIENDPELKIDEAEIDKILKEIEEEAEEETANVESPIVVDKNAVAEMKEKFKK